MDTLTTKEKLLQAGREEFLAKGYKDASLRAIVKSAGFTLGAFYGYYPSKEALFEELVEGPAEALYGIYAGVQANFVRLPANRQVQELDNSSADGLLEMIELIYVDFDVYKLLFFGASGTRYESYMQRFIDLEIDATHRFIEVLQKRGQVANVDEEIIHILASAMFSGMMEIVDHNMQKEKAVHYITQLRDFYSAGWHRLLGV
ncbi:TetR/AcrR family transcriptional regulator [Clostridia bacterium OttesenSCG-928-O13]|nr:TetR/AcrR family transcriptional regulator [Clostridia bacterium OttesenSCG-928-O13]